MRIRRPFVLVVFAMSSVVCCNMRAATISLYLGADQGTQTWRAYLSLDDPNRETLGLAGIEFSVVGSGGVTVTSSTNRLPIATESTDFITFFQKGFTNFRSDGTEGVGIRAAQDVFNTGSASGLNGNSILEGVGKMAFEEDNGALAGTEVSFPVLIATGGYTGLGGTISILGSPDSTTLLPANLPAIGAPITTFSPSAVYGDSANIVPEPGSAMLWTSGALLVCAMFWRRTVSHVMSR
jgi:hypothetical protein